MWEYVPAIFCPQCAAKAVWAGPRQAEGRAAFCLRCESRIVLRLTLKEHLGAQERDELADARRAANIDSNSAIGAFR